MSPADARGSGPTSPAEVGAVLVAALGEGRAGEGQLGEGRAGEGQLDAGRAGEGQLDAGRAGEGQLDAGQLDEGQAGEGQLGEGQLDEGQAGETATASISGGGRWARATVDVPPERWIDALTAARDELGCDFFDWLSAVDELDEGYAVVAHLWSTAQRHGVLVRTRVSRRAPRLDSAVALYPGADWHERETHEMFGVDFAGHPNLVPLLLPPEFEGHPLRKDFVLAARVAKPWPGAKEPGESHAEGTAKRQPMRPPGVPSPTEWGPGRAGPDTDPGEG